MVEEDTGGAGVGGGRADACPICLEPISGDAFLDQCFHRFCFHCILQWSEMLIAKPQSTSSRLQCLKCPLCKSHYTSIIHDISGAKFQRHYILTPHGTRYQRLDGHIQRQAVYASEVEQKLSRFTNVVPKPNRWLSVWVRRELQAIMQEEDVETVMQHVVGVVEAFYKRSGGKARIPTTGGGAKTKDLDWHTTVATAVQPFIFEHAEKFAEELGSFLLSGLDIVAYDQQNQVRASVAGQLSLIKDADLRGSSKESSAKNIFDLYDEDVDVDGVEVMVGRRIEAESRPSLLSDQVEEATDGLVNVGRTRESEYTFRAETSPSVPCVSETSPSVPCVSETSGNTERHNHEDDAQAQSHRHSEGDVAKKHKKKSRRPSDHGHEGSYSKSQHRREASKNRKRGRSSSRSPSGHS